MVGSLCHCLESVFCIHFLYLLQLDNKIAFRIFFSSSKRCSSLGSWTFLHVVHYATITVFFFSSVVRLPIVMGDSYSVIRKWHWIPIRMFHTGCQTIRTQAATSILRLLNMVFSKGSLWKLLMKNLIAVVHNSFVAGWLNFEDRRPGIIAKSFRRSPNNTFFFPHRIFSRKVRYFF